MTNRKPVLAAVGVLALAYLISPYVALYRLGEDLRAGNCDALETEVNWARVRDSLKQEMATRIAGRSPSEAAGSTELPPFGATFVTGIVHHMLDEVVTPEGLVNVVQKMQVSGAGKGGSSGMAWGFFEGPTSFVAWLDCGSGVERKSIVLRLALEKGWWRVTQVSLPVEGPQRRAPSKT